MMDLAGFEASLAEGTPPEGLGRPLRALWHLGKGDWNEAHAVVQEDEADPTCAWVHAHLHRVEGDPSNARYWYRRAGQSYEAYADAKAELAAIKAALTY